MTSRKCDVMALSRPALLDTTEEAGTADAITMQRRTPRVSLCLGLLLITTRRATVILSNDG
jgi:hypothetical protein